MQSALLVWGFMSMLLFELSDAPVLRITRDDHVATVEMDFDENADHGGQLWTVGTDGLDPVGYRIQWWPEATDTSAMVKGYGCSTDQSTGTLNFATEANPHEIVTANHVVQVQPIANNLTYHLRVTKLNSLGQECSPAVELSFEGGDGSRVQQLASEMVFFDDFNLEEGPADELKWNNAHTPQTDPRFNMFFINKQCHSHTLNGTLNGAAGDKSQVAQRPRKPILIEEETRRRIVFDMDGIFSPRGVWYLDLNPVQTDMTGHMSFFDSDGDVGLPADVLRIKARGHVLSVNLINSEGASLNVASVELGSVGRSMNTNVRRFFDVRVAADGIEIFVDNVSVINTTFEAGTLKPGVYHPLWSTIGYNTSKSDNPYFLSHWDNFGFDGPNLEPYQVHNYRTKIIGSDLQKANKSSGQVPEFIVNVPDDIRPVVQGISNKVYLVFSYMKNDFSTFNIEADDYILFNGVHYSLPYGANNTSPEVPELVNYEGSTISNRIFIGEVGMGEVSPVLLGENSIQFFATNTGIVNLHLEVLCPEEQPFPDYTPPQEIHPFNKHNDLPKLGIPSLITTIDSESPTEEDDNLLGPEVSGTVPVEFLVGNQSWAGWAPEWLNVPVISAESWSTGNTSGSAYVELFLRSIDNDSTSGYRMRLLNTNVDAPAPQVRYMLELDTRRVINGEYELFLLVTDSKGIKSHPSYSGFGFNWDASELSGAFKGVKITITNPISGNFTFEGTNGQEWTQDESWNGQLMPPYGYEGEITIDADCIVPADYLLEFEKSAQVKIKSGRTLTVQH